LSESAEEKIFAEMSRELLANLGYNIVKEGHTIDDKSISMCINFKSSTFLKPKYSPEGLCFVESDSNVIKSQSMLNNLAENIDCANKNKNYQQRIGGKVTGGIILNNTLRDELKKEMLDVAVSKGFFWWDIHRIFFYAMKVFSHSILENWVSQSKLGFVLREQEIKKQFETEHYHTTLFHGIRFSELSSKLEIYFSYFVDCLKDPIELKSGVDSLHAEHVKKILDDVYLQLENISKKYYPGTKKNVTIEIHSLSGFTYDAEFKVKLYAQNYKDWNSMDVDKITIDEHTLFKYAIIPWEAVMDYAFTKKTGIHTTEHEQIPKKLLEIESNFADEFRNAIKNGDIKEPFTNQFFEERDPITIEDKELETPVTSIYHAENKEIPIRQRLIIFSRTSIPEPRQQYLKKIIEKLATNSDYNYTWIGIMSSCGYSDDSKEFVDSWEKAGVGLALVDAVTKRLYVNTKTEEGEKINIMFLSECIA